MPTKGAADLLLRTGEWFLFRPDVMILYGEHMCPSPHKARTNPPFRGRFDPTLLSFPASSTAPLIQPGRGANTEPYRAFKSRSGIIRLSVEVSFTQISVYVRCLPCGWNHMLVIVLSLGCLWNVQLIKAGLNCPRIHRKQVSICG